MSSEIRTNLLKSRTGLSTVTLSDTGPVVTGIATFGVTTKIDGGNNVINVGTALTIGHTQGVQFHTQNLHSTGFEVNQVNASGIITASSYRGDGSQLTGISAGFNQDAQGNLVAGTNAGSSLDGSSAEYNILLGEGAGESIDGDDNNIAIGYDAGKNNTASSNIFIGKDSAKTLNSSLSSQNVFIGHEAVYNKSNVSGTVVGAQAGLGNGIGINLTLFGYRAGGNSYNSTTFVGHQAGRSATSTCDFTTAVGSNSLYNNAGRGNVAIGNLSGQVLTSGQFNTLAGYMAGRGALSGTINYTDCIAIGSSAAQNISSANNIIVIGANANPSSNTVTNEITLGNSSITKFRIPGIDFILKDNGGTPTQGHVLTVDGSGEAGFAAPAGPTINNNANTRVITASGNANEFDAQASLTFTSGGDPKLTISGTGHAQLNLTSTGGTDHTGINFGDSADINAGMIQYSNTGNTMQFHTNGSEKLRITDTGKLLVGATSGSSHYISGGSDTLNTVFQTNLGGAGATCAIRVKMNTSANNGLQIQQNGSGTSISGGAHAASIFNRENGKLRFGTNNTERLTIESNGHVYAQSQFTVKGELNMHSATTAAKYMDIGFQDNSFNMRRTNANDGGHSNFITVNASKVVSGNFNDTSDGKLKKNVAAISDGAIEDIKKLRPVTFDWIDETENNNVSGFIAQEVKQVLPNLVDGTEYDPAYNDESLGSKGGIKSVGYSINSVGVTAHLTKAVQELIAKVEKLEQENTALRIRLTNLEDN